MRVNRVWLGLIVLMLPTLLVAMDMTALLLALPRLSAGLGATNIQQLWISDSYGFMVAPATTSAGRSAWRCSAWRPQWSTASLHVTGVVAAAIFAGLAVLILTMRPATRTAPATRPDYEATRS